MDVRGDERLGRSERCQVPDLRTRPCRRISTGCWEGRERTEEGRNPGRERNVSGTEGTLRLPIPPASDTPWPPGTSGHDPAGKGAARLRVRTGRSSLPARPAARMPFPQTAPSSRALGEGRRRPRPSATGETDKRGRSGGYAVTSGRWTRARACSSSAASSSVIRPPSTRLCP